MILGISNDNKKFILKKEGKFKYFSLDNGQYLLDSSFASIDFLKNGIICIIKNESKSIEFFNMNNEEKITELNLDNSFEMIIDISEDLSYILIHVKRSAKLGS